MSAKLIAMLRAQLAALKADKIGPLQARLEAGETLPDADSAQLDAYLAEGDKLTDRIGELQAAETKRLAAERRDLEFDKLAGAPDRVEHGAGQPPGTGLDTHDRPLPPIDLGAHFVASPQFKAAKQRGGNSDAVTVNLALIKSVDANGKPLAGVARVRDQAQPNRATPLLDACGFEPVKSNSFELVTWPLNLPRAGVVAEGMPKPEATDAPVLVPGVLEKLAHWIPITQEYLEDDERLAAITRGRLVDGVLDKAEAQAAAQLVAATLPTAEGETLLAAIRVGIAEVQTRGFQGPGLTVVMNPMDWATIDISLLGSTIRGAEMNAPLWALNVVGAGAVPAGTAYVGDFKSGMTVYARSQVVVRMTDSHADYFISNQLVILAEQRVKTVVTQPNAIVECTAAVIP